MTLVEGKEELEDRIADVLDQFSEEEQDDLLDHLNTLFRNSLENFGYTLISNESLKYLRHAP